MTESFIIHNVEKERSRLPLHLRRKFCRILYRSKEGNWYLDPDQKTEVPPPGDCEKMNHEML